MNADDRPILLLDGGDIDPRAPWPLPDRRRMRDESGFAMLDEHIGALVRQQEAEIVRNHKRQQHDRIRASLLADTASEAVMLLNAPWKALADDIRSQR